MSALDEVIAYISQDSPHRAARVLTRALDAAASLSSFADRGRIVREVGDPALRQLLVYSYRLMYRVHDDQVVIRAFVHGARNFATWRQEEAPEL